MTSSGATAGDGDGMAILSGTGPTGIGHAGGQDSVPGALGTPGTGIVGVMTPGTDPFTTTAPVPTMPEAAYITVAERTYAATTRQPGSAGVTEWAEPASTAVWQAVQSDADAAAQAVILLPHLSKEPEPE